MVAVRQRHRPTSCSVWQRRPAVPAGVTTMCRRRGSCGASSGQTEQSRVRIPRPRPTHYKCVALPSELTRREMGPPCPHASAPTVCGYPPQAHWAAVHASGDGEATSWWQGRDSNSRFPDYEPGEMARLLYPASILCRDPRRVRCSSASRLWQRRPLAIGPGRSCVSRCSADAIGVAAHPLGPVVIGGGRRPWRRRESNARHHACKACALPTELHPQVAVWCARSDSRQRG